MESFKYSNGVVFIIMAINLKLEYKDHVFIFG